MITYSRRSISWPCAIFGHPYQWGELMFFMVGGERDNWPVRPVSDGRLVGDRAGFLGLLTPTYFFDIPGLQKT